METSHVHVIFQLFLFFYSSSFYYQLAFFVFTSHYLSSSSSSFLLLHLVFLLTLFSLLHLLYSPPSLSPLLSLLILIYSYRSTKQSRLKNRFVRTCMYSTQVDKFVYIFISTFSSTISMSSITIHSCS